MKLIVSEFNALRGYVSREFFHILGTLTARHGWQNIERYELWRDTGPLDQRLLRRFGRLPEVVLFWEGYDFVDAHRAALAGLGSRLCIFSDDLHHAKRHAQMQRSFEVCDVILAAYANVFAEHFPGVAGTGRVAWVPHSASPDFWQTYNENPANTVLLSGAINEHYPLRQAMKVLHDTDKADIRWHPHPGYHCSYDYDRNPDVGPSYAATIREHRAAFTDALKYRYLVAKHFEIPATGSLLLADQVVENALEQLGFVEEVHYMAATKRNLAERIRHVLAPQNHEHTDRVRRRGQALVMERHKTADRAAAIDAMCSTSDTGGGGRAQGGLHLFHA